MFSASQSAHFLSSITNQSSSSSTLVLFFYVVALNFVVATKLSVMSFHEKALSSQILVCIC